jgi:hypothetical protein
MKYSSSPWKYVETDDGDILVVMDKTHDILIGNLEDSCGICQANARLISTAPELLEALENLIVATRYMREEYSDANDEVEKAESIIDKAKGYKL